MKITLFDLRLLDFYLMYFDFKLKESAQEHGHGIALKNIPPFDVLKQYLIPIPPIEEQKKIIKSINSLLEMVDLIDSNSNEVAELINFTKSKILDLAIRGKLVPQDPNDEPASVLLERIRTEKEELIKAGKIKRDKKESIIFRGEDNSYYEKIGSTIKNIDDSIPFEIPENWCFIRLKELWKLISGRDLSPSEYNDNQDGIPYITATHDVNNPRSGGVMRQLGMQYQYSYEEQWQPKNLFVTFRMYQFNFDGQEDRVYQKYWDLCDTHFIETEI